jgi:DNA-binding MarR family transcriptional regulator
VKKVTGDIWLSDPQQRAWRAFIGMQARLRASIARQLQRESGLSEADYEVLVNLSEADGQRLRAYQLGASTGWEKSRLSHHLTRMEGRGLVRREPCAHDPRYADVILTEAGRSAIQDAAPRHVAHVRQWFVDAMTPDQLDAFATACEAVLAKLDADGTDPCGADC